MSGFEVTFLYSASDISGTAPGVDMVMVSLRPLQATSEPSLLFDHPPLFASTRYDQAEQDQQQTATQLEPKKSCGKRYKNVTQTPPSSDLENMFVVTFLKTARLRRTTGGGDCCCCRCCYYSRLQLVDDGHTCTHTYIELKKPSVVRPIYSSTYT